MNAKCFAELYEFNYLVFKSTYLYHTPPPNSQIVIIYIYIILNYIAYDYKSDWKLWAFYCNFHSPIRIMYMQAPPGVPN